MDFRPSYIELLNNGYLKERSEIINRLLEECLCCPHNCGSNRISGERGICKSAHLPIVSSYAPHFGEEPVLSGSKGAGNIFFGNCNLECMYCQNYEISQNWKEEIKHEVSCERLAGIMIELQNRGCHNIGLVSPTHFTAPILKSILIAGEHGLNLPIIYNSNGYDSVEVLKLLDGVIDIYLPDFKYGGNENAKKYSKATNYFEYAKNAIKEMYNQIGDELIIENEVLKRGLIIRHLVLPNNLAESEKVFEFISKELSPNVFISVMSQYFPTHKAANALLLNRTIKVKEYENILDLLDKFNLQNGWVQELESSDYYRPYFNDSREKPFDSFL